MKEKKPPYMSQQALLIGNLVTMLIDARAEEQLDTHSCFVNRRLAKDPECDQAGATLRARYFEGCLWGCAILRRTISDLLEELEVEPDSINSFLWDMPLECWHENSYAKYEHILADAKEAALPEEPERAANEADGTEPEEE